MGLWFIRRSTLWTFVKNFLRTNILPHLTLLIFRLLWWSWRITLIEPAEMQSFLKEKRPLILAHWHGDEIALLHLVRRYRLATITSTSKDGELMTRVISKLGGVSSRGSSTRGGVSALKGILRLLKTGEHNCSIAVDGPKGPIYKVKPGIFEISRLVGAPIYWVGVSADRFYKFEKAWNKAILPKPFARVYIEWHGPMSPVTKNDDPKSEGLASRLEQNLNAAKHQATKQFEIG